MVIAIDSFPLYEIIIIFSVLVGMIYIFLNLKNEIKNNKQILFFFIIYLIFSFVFGKIYTALLYGQENFLEAGLSAYGGLVGVVIAAIIFEKKVPLDGKIIKYTILSLPLVYGLTKIACFFAGCCYGIPYDGIFKIIYPRSIDISVFPIQLLETIVFLAIYFIGNKYKNNKDIIFIVLSLVFTFKFLLDFLRYDHINIVFTRNQIFSIILLIINISLYIKNYKRQY